MDDQEFEENEVYAIDIVVRALWRACWLALGVSAGPAPSRVCGSGSCGTVVWGPCERGASLMQVRGRARCASGLRGWLRTSCDAARAGRRVAGRGEACVAER